MESHGERRGPYRKYLQDPDIEIPKATMWQYKRLKGSDIPNALKRFRSDSSSGHSREFYCMSLLYIYCCIESTVIFRLIIRKILT